MKVYIVEFSVDYEGATVEGVFTTPDKARTFVEKNINNRSQYLSPLQWVADQDGCWRYGDRAYTILEHEVDSK